MFVHHHGKKSKKRYGKKHPKELVMLIRDYKLPIKPGSKQRLDLSNCFIMDDHRDVKSSQPQNCFAVPAWSAFDDYGTANKKAVLDQFLKEKGRVLAAKYLEAYKASGGSVKDIEALDKKRSEPVEEKSTTAESSPSMEGTKSAENVEAAESTEGKKGEGSTLDKLSKATNIA